MSDRLKDLSKRIMFAFLGALAVLIACGVGGAMLFPSGASEVVLREGEAPLFISCEEITKRRKELGGKTGDVVVTLAYEGSDDLDVHCIEPSSDHISFQNMVSLSGGELDVDANAEIPYLEKPLENIYWPGGKAPEGRYKVFVHLFAKREMKQKETGFTVQVINKGVVSHYRGAVSTLNPVQHIKEFVVEQGAPKHSSLLHFWLMVLKAGLWASLAALGLCLLLVLGQCLYLRRNLKSPAEWAKSALGSFCAGFLGGAAAQALYGAWTLLTDLPPAAGQMIGWIILASVLGALLHIFIPNLGRKDSLAAGVLGGLTGGAAFLFLSSALNDSTGRLAGAAAIGLLIGFMIKLAEETVMASAGRLAYAPAVLIRTYRLNMGLVRPNRLLNRRLR
jgi:hypothetical protein